MEGKTMKRLMQIALVGVFLLAVVSIAVAQETLTLQPVMRLGNFMEVANDVFMHIIATSEMRFVTVQNRDFEQNVRDRTNSRFPDDTAAQSTDSDAVWFQNRIGVEARYQKNLELYLLFEHRQFVDGNTIDDRSNSTTPGGTDVFGRPAVTENAGFHTERYWIRYKFPGTPLKLHVGADLWNVDQAGLVGDDDPRIALFADFGDFDAMAAAVMQYSGQRLGLENDNDLIYYTFSAGYNLKPHRFQLDVFYFRDRFAGADLSFPRTTGNGIGFQGQESDAVMLSASWSGRLGPVRGLLQADGVFGRAHGGTAGLPGFPAGVASQRAYDILAGAAVAYVEADLGLARPFVAFVIGTPDGDPTDRKLRGFAPASWQDVTQITGVSWFEHLDTSTNFAGRDYACPARFQGVRQTANALTGPLAIGGSVSTGGGTGFECSHSVTNPFNQRLGASSHLGIFSTYSNPGTLVIAPGVKVYPAKGHEIVGGYVYRGMLNTSLLERAFRVGVDPGFTGKFDKAQVHEVWAYWQWTLNPYFDIRLAGNAGFLGEGFLDLAKLSDCNQQLPGFQGCTGKTTALKAEARFRARF
jgi:hypothetical protein